MRTYFIEIAAVNCAAKLLEMRLTGDYALYGSLERFRNKKLGAVQAVDGMEDIEERAESFRFGTRCGKVLADYTSALQASATNAAVGFACAR